MASAGLTGARVTTIADDQFEAGHTEERPSWDCRSCTQPWPCANAKDWLITEFQGLPSLLTIYMSALINEAMIDLTAHGGGPPSDLQERFLSWISPTTEKPREERGFPPGQSSHFQTNRDRRPADRSYYSRPHRSYDIR